MDLCGAAAVLIRVWIEDSQPLAGTAAIEGGEPLPSTGGWNCSGWSRNLSPQALPITEIRTRPRELMGESQARIQADRR